MTNHPVIDAATFRKACDKVLAGRADQIWLEDIILQFIIACAPAGEQPEQAGDMAKLIAECRDALSAAYPYMEGSSITFAYTKRQVKEQIERCELALAAPTMPDAPDSNAGDEHGETRTTTRAVQGTTSGTPARDGLVETIASIIHTAAGASVDYEHAREVAMMAEEIAFYAFQAKHYCAQVYNGGKSPTEKEIDEATKQLEKNRIAENRERGGILQDGSDTFLYHHAAGADKSAEERVKDALAEAQKTIAPIVAAEREAEKIPQGLMEFRMGADKEDGGAK